MNTNSIDTIRKEATRRQRLAADPAVSAWVSANAGTGKTHVLVQRVLRLLLAGTPVGGILCITFTKAAAAEMSNRLIRELGRWAALPDTDLTAALSALLEQAPTAEELAIARCLFAEVLDALGGLKIMTIHAFCDRVLRRFPLEAGVPPGFTIFTDEERRAALRNAADAVLGEAAADPESTLGKALAISVANAGEERFDTLLHSALGKWDDIARAIHQQFTDDPFGGLEDALRVSLGAGQGGTPETLQAEQAAILPDSLIDRVGKIFPMGGKTDQKIAAVLQTAIGVPEIERIAAFRTAFFTKAGEPRANIATKAIQESYPLLVDELDAARARFAALEARRRALDIAIATTALLRLADAVCVRYEEAKAHATALDFDALITKTAQLFNQSDASAWVLYRLDADLTHILVDEAQDTSPAQWALIQALTAEFFTGASAGEQQRTLFAVGDEKQSIYSFQGAEPRRFAEAGRDFAARAQASGEIWRQTPLTLSFRSTKAVLDAVDAVFANPSKTFGVARGGDGQPIKHSVNRVGEAGLVEIWPVERAVEQEPIPVWEPFAENENSVPPSVALANRIARQIRYWLDTGEVLTSQNRPIRAGDILILVRKRMPFAAPMVKALKEHGIPVAGADRLRLTGQLAVMDLMVLGDVLLLPQDDLALATLLKSPIFDLSDDDLFAIGYGREGSLWAALRIMAEENERMAIVVARLERWRALAAQQRPYEFYVARLEAEGLRETLIARLGVEAADAIAEFLNLALDYEARHAPSLQGFLHWLRISDPEIKRDMEQERDEVRVMTVHGAKGLEAGIVFLPDTCAVRSGGRGGLIMLEPQPEIRGALKLPVWMLPGAATVPQIREAQDAIQIGEREEYHRLLYVAMTRARDRLYVAGFQGQRDRDKGCWYDLIDEGLASNLVVVKDYEGNPVRRLVNVQTAPLPVSEICDAKPAVELVPDWVSRLAPTERLAGAVAPSHIKAAVLERAEFAHDLNGTQLDQVASRDEAMLRGRLVHRLLELLPTVPVEERNAAGRRFLLVEGDTLTTEARETLLAGVIRIIEMPPFAEVFGPGSRAEVALATELLPHNGAPLIISGQIDRLIEKPGEIVAVDFKTGAVVPRRPEYTPPTYLAQLAAYRFVLKQLFPEKTVRIALLWTSIPTLMEIPGEILAVVETQLFATLGSLHLDDALLRA
jgi:ATP-dependent helicase/nuclease subunit A